MEESVQIAKLMDKTIILGLSVFLLFLGTMLACLLTSSPDETIEVDIHRRDNQIFLDISTRKRPVVLSYTAPLYGVEVNLLPGEDERGYVEHMRYLLGMDSQGELIATCVHGWSRGAIRDDFDKLTTYHAKLGGEICTLLNGVRIDSLKALVTGYYLFPEGLLRRDERPWKVCCAAVRRLALKVLDVGGVDS